MITTGHLSALEASVQLDQIEHWQQAIEARGTVAGVALTLTRPELSIRDLGGTLVLTQGKLTAERVQATTGKSRVHNGRIDLDFTAARTAVSATALWHTDLGEALAFTKRQLASPARERVEVLRALSGDARGTVSLNGAFDTLRILAEAETIRAQASLEPLPWPINVTGAKARFDGSGLVVQGLTGTVGSSGFSQCSGQVTLAASARLHVSRCDADLALVELFDWGSRQWKMPDALEGLRVLGGRGLVQVHRIGGALEEPTKWSVDISATPQALRLRHPGSPGGGASGRRERAERPRLVHVSGSEGRGAGCRAADERRRVRSARRPTTPGHTGDRPRRREDPRVGLGARRARARRRRASPRSRRAPRGSGGR